MESFYVLCRLRIILVANVCRSYTVEEEDEEGAWHEERVIREFRLREVRHNVMSCSEKCTPEYSVNMSYSHVAIPPRISHCVLFVVVQHLIGCGEKE